MVVDCLLAYEDLRPFFNASGQRCNDLYALNVHLQYLNAAVARQTEGYIARSIDNEETKAHHRKAFGPWLALWTAKRKTINSTVFIRESG